MEYLPSGELCTGTVTKVHPTGFAAVCHLPSATTLRRGSLASERQRRVANGVITAHP